MELNEDRYRELMSHLVVAEKAFPKGLKKILVVGFTKKAGEIPFAAVFDASPATLVENAKTVVSLFELKGIESYVFCIEVAAIRADRGMTREEIERIVDMEDDPLNALLLVVNLGDGHPEAFLIKDGDEVPMLTNLPPNHPFGAFMGLSPADEPRRIAKRFISQLSPEDKAQFVSEAERISYRSDLEGAASEIRRRVDEGTPTIH